MAFSNLYPEIDIKFNYNVSRSIFCEILTKGIKLTKITDEILNEVSRIINLDLPIERVTLTVKEAIEIYKELRHDDKLNILEYRPDKIVHLYKLFLLCHRAFIASDMACLCCLVFGWFLNA